METTNTETEEKKAGRPTDYNPEILKKAQEYLDDCEDEEVQVVKQSNADKGYEMYDNKLKVKLPTVEGLAYFLKVSRDTLYEWEKKHPEFSDIMDDLRAKQADALINNGLSGDYNSTIAKVLLTKHGYREGVEATGKDGKDLIPEPLSKEKQTELLGLLDRKKGD